ncbi:MAG TPA: arylsulfotransferase family protein [Conexibacter sp.]|nr:arylsulfotransferase family protein [Conexibacter sp.]
MLRRTSWSALTVAVAIAAAIGCGTATAAVVDVYPTPGTQFASPHTQLSFRGVAPDKLGAFSVTGSVTGVHTGHVAAHSDGHGASFLPDRSFAQGETVTVRTSLPIHLGHAGAYSIRIATQGPPIRPLPRDPPLLLHGPGLQYFHSRHDLHPATLTASAAHGATAPGDLFVGLFAAPFQTGPGQIGPAIFDANARLVWFHPLRPGQVALDVKVQQYGGKAALTWWQGYVNAGVGVGVGKVFDTSYRQVATVSAGNGYGADPHEFKLTPRGTALFVAENPVVQDLSAIHGAKQAVVYDAVVQEIDVKTGLVLFEWHSLDHVGVAESYNPTPSVNGHADDYFHINSVDDTPDGNLIVSARNTWAIYKIARADGAVHWRLNGKRSSFRMLRGSTFAWQHDARVQADGTITLFDDGAAPAIHKTSRAIGIGIDTRAHRAWLRHDYRPSPATLANSQGNAQVLPGGDVLVGWGSSPFITEFSAHGAVRRLYTYARGEESYRAYRFPWDPRPLTKPAVAASTAGARTQVYMSWNGAADVASWQVLAGASASALKPVASVRDAGFETSASIAGAAFVAVQARDAHGTVLSTSGTVAPS